MVSFVNSTYGFLEKMTSFSFFKYFDAFELDVNVVNFVYYGKTRIDWRIQGRGTRDEHPNPPIQFLFNFMRFWANCQNNTLEHPTLGLAPRLGIPKYTTAMMFSRNK